LTVYGLADRRLAETELDKVVELFATREQAARALRDVLHDEPGWADEISLVEIELGSGLTYRAADLIRHALGRSRPAS
jgi:hypothetical protein